MTQGDPLPTTLARSTYCALRQGGAPPRSVQAQLGLPAHLCSRFERLVLAGHGLRPRFARHQPHVAAVLAAGGYPVLPERRR